MKKYVGNGRPSAYRKFKYKDLYEVLIRQEITKSQFKSWMSEHSFKYFRKGYDKALEDAK